MARKKRDTRTRAQRSAAWIRKRAHAARLPLNIRHVQTLMGIIGYLEDYGYLPTLREIQAFAAWSSYSEAAEALDRLAEHGLIRRGPKNASRAIDVRPALVVGWTRESYPDETPAPPPTRKVIVGSRYDPVTNRSTPVRAPRPTARKSNKNIS